MYPVLFCLQVRLVVDCQLLHLDLLVVFLINTDQDRSRVAAVGCVQLVAAEEGARHSGAAELHIELAVRLHVCLALDDAIVEGLLEDLSLLLGRNLSFSVFFLRVRLLYAFFGLLFLEADLVADEVS